jgi:hypothetical protein
VERGEPRCGAPDCEDPALVRVTEEDPYEVQAHAGEESVILCASCFLEAQEG